MNFKSILLVLCLIGTMISAKATASNILLNDTLKIQHAAIPGDFADPTIIRIGKTYYAAGTSSEWAPHFPLFKSNNLKQWQPAGYIFDQKPDWTSSSFWAPELFYYKGKCLAYYTARRKSDGISCIGLAVADHPEKGFTDKGVILSHGKEAIDPFVFQDKGKLYFSWKAYGLENRPIELLCAELSEDGTKVVGEPFSLLKDDERKGLEGQCIIKNGNYYYLLYSVGDCCGRGCSYEVKVARSTSLQGSFEKLPDPILTAGESWKCTGHGTVVNTPNGRQFYLYHAYQQKENVYNGRQGMLAELFFDQQTQWPYFKTNTLNVAAQGKTFKDDFSTQKVADQWQWDVAFAKPKMSQAKGNLILGSTTQSNAGTVLTVRPEKANFSFTTTVDNANGALKGLTYYGDEKNCIGVGIRGTEVAVWQIKDGKKEIVKSTSVAEAEQLSLKITVKDGYLCQFFYKENSGNWKILTISPDFLDASFLPRWDRSARPGLMQQGAADQPAAFAHFEINYQ